MWNVFLGFEVRYWLRSVMVWVFFFIIGLMVFGAVSSDHVTLGGALQNTDRNAPFVIENYYSFMCLLTLLMTTAFVNSAAARDFAYNTYGLVFSKPVRKLDFLLGRYLGSALISVLPMLGITAGVLLAKYMPWVDAERWGPINWMAHLDGILMFAVPNTLFLAAIIFTIAALTRSTITSFVGSLILLAVYGVSQALTSDLRHETVAALLDPFGIRAFALTTKYWTVAEKNHQSLGASGLLLWNRLLWLAVGAGIFCFAYVRFQFAERAVSAKKRIAVDDEAVAVAGAPALAAHTRFGFAAGLAQLWGTLKTEFRGLVRSTSFIVIGLAALLNSVPAMIISANEGFGNSSMPVTYHILDMIKGTLYAFLLAMITYYAGVTIWRDRDNRMDEIADALPHAEWPVYLGKLVALLGSIAAILLLDIGAGVLVQTFSGYHRYQFGLYGTELLFLDFTGFIFLAILAFFIHVVSPNKYVGYFAFIVFAIANAFAWRPLNVGTRLVKFGDQPDYVYSDFFGYAPYLKSWTWFTAYWFAFCGVLAGVTILLWPRGRETGWRYRLRNARFGFTGFARMWIIGMLAAFAAIGGWIYYNTEILNPLITSDDADRRRADYEKTYKKYEKQILPRILSVKYNIELYPERRAVEVKGDQIIRNESGQPIQEMQFTVDPDYETAINIDRATLVQNDKRLCYRIYRLATPMQPNEDRHMGFTVSRSPRGFENSVSVLELVQNGTFFNNSIAPQIGYQTGDELTDRNQRKKFGLKEKDPMPALERNCTADCRNSYISNSSDWVDVESVLGTSADQIAIAPGSLVREWNANGRHYYDYKLDHSSLNFYSFLSGRYEVAREEWKGIKIEVYYLKEHPWNVPKMLRSVRKSFEYYTVNFGPYPHKEARIIEFPRVARFAQAFAGTMPYSESIGFIADLKHPDDIDLVYYVVAHEMGHQWWAHQVVGANMQGATLLSETLAQYSALMVMEKEYGRDTMRRFLEYEMDNYLRSRGQELLKEKPLLRVEASQGYVHYRKGSVVMYYLKEMIGEQAVNRALRKVLQQYGYAPPPYPTSYALVDALRDETPPELQYLLKDLFEEITLFSNRALSATAKKRADGKYDVTIEVETRKFHADERGNETEAPVNDWIEIGALTKPEKGKKFGKVLYRERVHMTTGRSTYRFTVDTEPDKAGIDPMLMLIDRIPDDNLKAVDIVRGS